MVQLRSTEQLEQTSLASHAIGALTGQWQRMMELLRRAVPDERSPARHRWRRPRLQQ
ncbi:hypothetical protein XFF6992_300017 [Xanthomonas citri pv. fuscans]|uniref:Uncharacterized protein n=1 Tax=Xanthomonas campestris pv. phaseoli TaxID=317013 RepID=A0A7Z7NHZ7_XANCH|nr:hypothetical protein XFF6990_200305 [Xanthomonas citri pv. fuscans]SOO19131.1 hypothetical protein XFF6992_300017 [Xanthomonas citri pv. fuscans]SOO25547.1 hypothetical protein XFF6991_460102 [Xanthomonas phaseoli pv. phaseoli]SOO33066.1 hypothetical protein XFF6994_2600021 [Xanthomonas citri pv. fuscans]